MRPFVTSRVRRVAQTTQSAGPSNWPARSTAPNVVAAYDFSAAPAGGGDYKWGAIRAAGAGNSQVTCWLENASFYPTNGTIDTTVGPADSNAAIKYTITNSDGETGLNWRISIDDWNYQFDGDVVGQREFWIQWRVYMDEPYAHWRFPQHPSGDPNWDGVSYTGYKINFLSAGPQYPITWGTDGGGHPFTPTYGYPTSTQNGWAVGTTLTTLNSLYNTNVAGKPEIEITTIDSSVQGIIDATHAYHYPWPYHSQFSYAPFLSSWGSGYYSMRNEGIEASHTAACQFIQSTGNQYTDITTCFNYVPSQWHTIMIHVTLGPKGTATSSLGGGPLIGYTDSVVEFYGMYDPAVYSGEAMRLLHRRTGVTLETDTDGAQGATRYGSFAVTPFMTQLVYNGSAPTRPDAHVYFSQILWSKTRPLDPSPWPAWVSGLSDFQVRNLTGTYAPSGHATLGSLMPSEWIGGSSPQSEVSIMAAWSGGKADQTGKRLFVHGGGHSDCANNGIYIYDFNGAVPLGWTLAPNSLSALSAVQDSNLYTDNYPAAIHSYDGLWYDQIRRRLYRFTGSRWNNGSPSECFYYDELLQQWSSVTTPGSHFGTVSGTSHGCSVIARDAQYAVADIGSVFFLIDGDTNGSCFWLDSAGTTVTTGWPTGYHANSNGATQTAVKLGDDRTWLTLSVESSTSSTAYVFTHSIDWTNHVDTVTQHTHSSHATYLPWATGSSGASLVYDPDHSAGPCVWIFGMGSQQTTGTMTAQLLRMDLGDWSITAHSLSGDTIANDDTTGSMASYNRHIYFPQYRVIGTVQSYNAPMSVIKLPT